MEAILQLDAFNNDTLRPGADGRPDFSGERFVYLGDQANMPYGNYPALGRTDFLRELILKDLVFLLGTRVRSNATSSASFDKPPVKAIVIACNTATAYGLEDIRAALRAWELNVPVIGVVEAGARDLASSLPEDARPRGVAVLATVGTCDSGAYPKAISSASGRAGKRSPVVVQQGSVGLAGAIEGNQAFITDAGQGGPRALPYQGPVIDPALLAAYRFSPAGLLGSGRETQLNSLENYTRYEVTTLLERHRVTGGPAIDTVVLGCTHFPLIRSEFENAFRFARNYQAADGSRPYQPLVAEPIRFIDPAESTARELFVELARARLRNRAGEKAPSAEFFLSVPNPQEPGIVLGADGSLDPKYKTERTVGRFHVEETLVVPLTAKTLPSSSAKLVRALPAVWKELGGESRKRADGAD